LSGPIGGLVVTWLARWIVRETTFETSDGAIVGCLPILAIHSHVEAFVNIILT